MTFDDGFPGNPFPGDYRGRPEHEQWDELEARVQRDVTDLVLRRYEPAVRHELLRLMRQRREGARPEPATQPAGHRRPDAFTQFDVLPVRVGFDTLLARGELLITGQSYDGRHPMAAERGPDLHAKRYLDAVGMDAHEVDCPELRDRVLRLVPRAEMSPQELADVAKVLRTRGFTASLTNITPTAPVTKGKGAPEPAGQLPGPPYPDEGQGEATRVAIIDTGIARQHRTDRWLENVRGDEDPLNQFPLPTPDEYLDLAAGHGTFVAGIVQQVAPRAEITVYQAVDSDGIASEVRVACEMIRAVKEGNAQVVNLSLGCQTLDNLPPIAIRAALDVIREWERAEKGREVIIVAAAGNFGDTTPCWPAAFRRVVSVAGLAPDLRPSQWSTHGFWVTCSTIGQGVRSTYVTGRESPLMDPAPHVFGPNAWAVWSGTSFAAPQITGALARLHEQNGLSLREGLRRLLAAGRPIPDFGRALRILPGI